MNRRKVLQSLGAFGVFAAPSAMVGQQTPHVHGTSAHQALVATASDCVVKGETCLAHCHKILAEGDKSLGPCAKSVSEMLALCGALRSLAAQNASSLPKLAAVALDACRRCETECRKHEMEHKECKDCAEACAACAAECQKIA